MRNKTPCWKPITKEQLIQHTIYAFHEAKVNASGENDRVVWFRETEKLVRRLLESLPAVVVKHHAEKVLESYNWSIE